MGKECFLNLAESVTKRLKFVTKIKDNMIEHYINARNLIE